VKRRYVDHNLFTNLSFTGGELNGYNVYSSVETHVDDPDGRHIEFVHSFVIFLVALYTVVVILHREVWIPRTILHKAWKDQTSRPDERERPERTSGEEIFTLRILRSIIAGSSQIDSASGKVREGNAMKPNVVVTT